MSFILPLITERLILRDFVEDDWRAAYCYASDPEVVRYMSWGPNDEETTRNHTLGRLERQAAVSRWDFDLAVILKENNQLIGACGVRVNDLAAGSAELGYAFNRNYWGHGYATEAARTSIAFGFEQLKLHRIFATCDTANLASAKVLEKIGLRREGHFLRNIRRQGEWRDSYYYAILEDEWRDVM